MRNALLWAVTVLAIVGGARPSRAAGPDHVPGHVLVQLVPTVAGDVAADVATTRGLASGVPESRLGALLHELGVRRAQRLFVPQAASYATARAALARAAARAARTNGRRDTPSPRVDLANVFVLDLAADADVTRAVAVLAADPAVVVVQPDHYGQALLVPNDPRFTCATPPCEPGDWQWALYRLRAPEAWQRTRGAGVVVAVVDSGLNRGHLDLGASIWANPGEVADGVDNDDNGYVDDLWGWDFVECNAHAISGPLETCVDANTPGGDADPSDDEGHGTAIAGIVGAVTDNSLDMAGLADGARLMAVRAVNKEYRTSDAELFPALVYAATNGARIIHMSLVSPPSPLFADAIRYAHELLRRSPGMTRLCSAEVVRAPNQLWWCKARSSAARV
jgi:subtilisin family serine protease